MNIYKTVVSVFVLCVTASPVGAAQLTLDAVALDYYLSQRIEAGSNITQSYNKADVDAYLAGGEYRTAFGSVQITNQLRNYFVFDLSSISHQVTGAKLRIFSNFDSFPCDHRGDIGCGYASDDASETLTFVDVQSVDALMSPNPGDEQAIFNDLGEGEVYGDISFTRDDVDLWLEIELTSAALTAINQGNGLWAIGGHVTSLSAPDGLPFNKEERLFIGHVAGVVPMPELILTPIPVPAAVWLFGSGLICLAAIARRKKTTTV